MMKITLNGDNINSQETAHEYIREKLDSEEYHGDNLDALWDVLSTYDQPLEISFVNIDDLNEYGDAIISVFEDAATDNINIILKDI